MPPYPHGSEGGRVGLHVGVPAATDWIPSAPGSGNHASRSDVWELHPAEYPVLSAPGVRAFADAL